MYFIVAETQSEKAPPGGSWSFTNQGSWWADSGETGRAEDIPVSSASLSSEGEVQVFPGLQWNATAFRVKSTDPELTHTKRKMCGEWFLFLNRL